MFHYNVNLMATQPNVMAIKIDFFLMAIKYFFHGH